MVYFCVFSSGYEVREQSDGNEREGNGKETSGCRKWILEKSWILLEDLCLWIAVDADVTGSGSLNLSSILDQTRKAMKPGSQESSRMEQSCYLVPLACSSCQRKSAMVGAMVGSMMIKFRTLGGAELNVKLQIASKLQDIIASFYSQ